MHDIQPSIGRTGLVARAVDGQYYYVRAVPTVEHAGLMLYSSVIALLDNNDSEFASFCGRDLSRPARGAKNYPPEYRLGLALDGRPAILETNRLYGVEQPRRAFRRGVFPPRGRCARRAQRYTYPAIGLYRRDVVDGIQPPYERSAASVATEFDTEQIKRPRTLFVRLHPDKRTSGEKSEPRPFGSAERRCSRKQIVRGRRRSNRETHCFDSDLSLDRAALFPRTAL